LHFEEVALQAQEDICVWTRIIGNPMRVDKGLIRRPNDAYWRAQRLSAKEEWVDGGED
jgi:hypothetical protein